MLKYLTIGIGHLFRSRSKRKVAARTEEGGDAMEREMGFFEHLEELRSMLLRCIGAFTVAVILAFVFSREIFDLMRYPLREAIRDEAPPAVANAAASTDPVELIHALACILLRGELPAAAAAPAAQLTAAQATMAAAHSTASGQGMVVMKFMDVFSILLNIGLVGGLALSSGFILYFASRFVGPALTPSEKKCVVPFCASAMLLFFSGCAFSFLFLIPVSIKVMFHFVRMFNLTMPWLASDYYGFVTMMTLLVGLTFQFPLVVIILQYLEIVKTATLFRVWRHVLVGILVVSLLVSPMGDPLSLSVLTGVLFLLYISAASIGGFLVRRKIRRREAEEAEYERSFGKPHPDKVAREAPALASASSDSVSETTAGDGENSYDSPYGTDDGTEDYNYEEPYDDSQDGLARDDSAAGGEDISSGDDATASTTASGDDAPATDRGGTACPPTPDAPDSPDVPAPEPTPPPATAFPANATRLGRQSDLDLIE